MQPIFHDYSQYTDKHKVKKIIAKHIAYAREYAYFTAPEQIDSFKWETLPPSFVIKSAKKSGLVIVKTDKDKINIPETKIQTKDWLKYGGVIIENFIGKNLKEYRLHYENSVLQYIETQGIRFDKNWNTDVKTEIQKPTNLQNIVDKGKLLTGLVENPPEIIIVDICNRELKTCCKVINDLFFGKYEFPTL